MKRQQIKRSLLAALVSGIFLPVGAQATTEAELLQKLEALTKEVEALKAQVAAQQKATQQVADKVEVAESKSLGKWLDIGGDYQFRIDSMKGETKNYSDVFTAFEGLQNAMLGAGTIGQLIAFNQQMSAITTYNQAASFAPAALASLGGLMSTYNIDPRIAASKPKNDTLYTHRFGLDLHAKVAQDVSLTTRLMMYKTFGDQSLDAISNAPNTPYFADRVGVFDGTLSHVPSDSYLNVDRAYVTWNNLFDEDIWFSVGRRPSTNGAPLNLKYNGEWPGRGGTPALLVDYAFDGMTLGYGFDSDALPGGYAKLCYGRGFESGFKWPPGNSLEDTDMVGIALVPIDTGATRVWLQWNRGMNIFDAPKMQNTYFGTTMPKTNLGDIDWLGAGIMGKVKNVGKGELYYFADLGLSRTHPNDNVSAQFGFQGLLTGGFFNPEAPKDKTGGAVFLGLRYDLPSKTKLGFEYNHGSKNWITFAPAAADMWTSKVGTRGNVYEVYLIQEFDAKPIASAQAKSFFRLGFQYYDFKYTGSNNWVGAPVKISDVNGQMMTMAPLSKAYDLYGTLEVRF
ncbi:DUF3373 domain-containing protein [Sulfuricystis multivorans]|uniref:DUF3373 domain-containing protein n=1 Tax=Sulfuricystis multivorans TaxID=2211108 RepID=UPI000F849ABF|nr:DUF3373 domain-containing protein [Sulfuricystis multivorans]